MAEGSNYTIRDLTQIFCVADSFVAEGSNYNIRDTNICVAEGIRDLTHIFVWQKAAIIL